jgi:RimJ/RimL family protein N-acetyltransferase
VPPLVAPDAPLDDGIIALRSFLPGDLAAVEAATRPGGNEGIWMILVRSDPERTLAEHIEGWSRPQPVGAALAIVRSKGGLPIGVAYLTPRGSDSIELTYGVAPPHRGRGIATRAARLAAAWLLRDRGWPRVELRIADDATASQRVAARAGFRPAGRVRTWVESVGHEFEDRLYIMTSEG